MKSIPIALQTYIDADATTLCYLCKVTTKGGTVYGFTNLDAPVTYDDGTGSLVYAADNGFTPERLQATADLAVDNTEIQGWVADTGITEAQIRAGLFDFAKIIVYRVNYLDLTAGHEIIVSGTAGETIFTELGWKTEFRSLTQQTKQPISKLYSITCRARFGSQPQPNCRATSRRVKVGGTGQSRRMDKRTLVNVKTIATTTVRRSRFFSTTVEPAIAPPPAPPNMSESPPPRPACNRMKTISTTEAIR